MRIICFFAAIILFTACKKSGADDRQSGPDASTLMDISYGPDARQKIDVYLPANRSSDSTKLILLIHGGGWDEGDKADFTAAVPVLQSYLPGYAIININYRLAAPGKIFFRRRRTI